MIALLRSCLFTVPLACALASSVALAAAGALTPADLAPLAADDFTAKSAAIDKLVATHDRVSLTVLNALANEQALATASGEVIVQQDESSDHALDPITGKTVATGDAQPITLNNLLRTKVAGAVAGLKLTSTDPATRRAAVDALLASPDSSMKPLIDEARAKETDPAIRRRLDTLWATTALTDSDAAKRLEAATLVSARRDPDMYALLRPLVAQKADGTFAEPDARVREAAQKGIDALDAMETQSRVAGTLFAGISLGSVLLLAALGLAITYGVIGVINMAHGEFLMIGAYATYVVQNLFQRCAPGAFDWYPLAAVPASFVAAAAVGVAIERLVIRHLYGRPLETLLTTFGVSLVLMQATRTIFGAQNVQVSNPGWMTGGVALLPNLILPYNRLAILAFSIAVVAIAWAVLTRTRLGLFVRAVTQNRSMAACVGIKTARIDSYAFAFGAGIAGPSADARSRRSATSGPISAKATSSTRSWPWCSAAWGSSRAPCSAASASACWPKPSSRSRAPCSRKSPCSS